MTTRISGVFVPEVLTAQIAAEMDTRTNNLIRSGAVVVDPFLAAAAAQNKGSKITIPQYASYTAEDQIGSDTDPAQAGASAAITGTPTAAQVNAAGQSGVVQGLLTTNARSSFEVDVPMLRRVVNFSAMDLARAEANADPLGDVAVQAAEQIIKNQNAIIISSLQGVLADNIANDSSNMLEDEAAANTTTRSTAAGSETVLTRKSVINAVADWGDYGNQAAALVMHSAVYYGLLSRDTTGFRQEGEQGFVNTYMGIPIVLDDQMPQDPAGSGGAVRYITAVMAPGAVGFASIQSSPVLDRNERVGNGWGQETLIVRRTDLVNPRGIDFRGSASNVANTVLDDAGSWDRLWQRKNVGISFIRSHA